MTGETMVLAALHLCASVLRWLAQGDRAALWAIPAYLLAFSPLLVTPSHAQQNLEGTRWQGEISQGETAIYDFLPRGKLSALTRGQNSPAPGKWRQSGKTVIMSLDEGSARFTGRYVDPNTIVLRGISKNRKVLKLTLTYLARSAPLKIDKQKISKAKAMLVAECEANTVTSARYDCQCIAQEFETRASSGGLTTHETGNIFHNVTLGRYGCANPAGITKDIFAWCQEHQLMFNKKASTDKKNSICDCTAKDVAMRFSADPNGQRYSKFSSAALVSCEKQHN